MSSRPECVHFKLISNKKNFFPLLFVALTDFANRQSALWYFRRERTNQLDQLWHSPMVVQRATTYSNKFHQTNESISRWGVGHTRASHRLYMGIFMVGDISKYGNILHKHTHTRVTFRISGLASPRVWLQVMCLWHISTKMANNSCAQQKSAPGNHTSKIIYSVDRYIKCRRIIYELLWKHTPHTHSSH